MYASQVGLLINSTKAKILETLTSPNTITLNGNDIEKVNHFTYLGSYISNDGNIVKEVKAKAAAIFRKLNTIWKSNNISRNLKLKIFHSDVITSLSYGSECRYSTKAIEEKLITFENKCLRKIMNIRSYEFKTNKEIREMSKQLYITTVIRSRRWGYYGHAPRMNDTKIPKQLTK